MVTSGSVAAHVVDRRAGGGGSRPRTPDRRAAAVRRRTLREVSGGRPGAPGCRSRSRASSSSDAVQMASPEGARDLAAQHRPVTRIVGDVAVVGRLGDPGDRGVEAGQVVRVERSPRSPSLDHVHQHHGAEPQAASATRSRQPVALAGRSWRAPAAAWWRTRGHRVSCGAGRLPRPLPPWSQYRCPRRASQLRGHRPARRA